MGNRALPPPPCPLSDDYWLICPFFPKMEAEDTALNYQTFALFYTMFYAVVVNDALELGGLKPISLPI